ncbi:MAG: hypothetical protein ABS944_05815 [Solibacillus sp.]
MYKNDRSRAEIVKEYGLTLSALDRWVKNQKETGSLPFD